MNSITFDVAANPMAIEFDGEIEGETFTAHLQLPDTADSQHLINEEGYLYDDDTEERQRIFDECTKYYRYSFSNADLAAASAALCTLVEEIDYDDIDDEGYITAINGEGEKHKIKVSRVRDYYNVPALFEKKL